MMIKQNIYFYNLNSPLHNMFCILSNSHIIIINDKEGKWGMKKKNKMIDKMLKKIGVKKGNIVHDIEI